MSKKLAIGDVFEVPIGSDRVRYFQYVADDSSQLDSQVVRVLKQDHIESADNEPEVLLHSEVDFYAHVFLKNGIREGLWRKIGHAKPPSSVDVLFRDTNDYGDPEIVVSQNWHIWRIGGPFEHVGPLTPKYHHAEIGVVVPPDSLVFRMQNGEYDFLYPRF